ncbi:hypothetical protein EWM64_g659 [Hericium alpestre]|uniref:Isomerase YbhE n=1 Tax=Hericium alpestre TaxID=135208 RepID=A0A4Z0A8G1_9AGAM|nr:hypothetical protein EWM64_g659 [Hericium alpestre]
MVNFTILASGYAVPGFIASYLFNTEAATLTLLNQSPTGDNPSWISPHPTNSSILYSVNENAQGGLQSFTIGNQGVLSAPVETIQSEGDSPAFTVPLSTGQVAIMNYGSGNGLIVPTEGDPLHFGTPDLITFPLQASGISHPHMAFQHGEGVLVPDLGGDMIWRLAQNGSTGSWRIQGQIPQPQGSGPRHIALFDNFLYTLHETASTLTVQPLPAAPNGTSTIVTQVSTVPSNDLNLTNATWAAAEILLPALNQRFQKAFVYTSNRNTGSTVDPHGDTIAIWSIEPEGKVTLVRQVYTGLQQVRGMMIGGDDDEFIVAGGVVGTGGVLVLKRTEGGSNLEEVVRNTDIPNRTSFVWGKW